MIRVCTAPQVKLFGKLYVIITPSGSVLAVNLFPLSRQSTPLAAQCWQSNTPLSPNATTCDCGTFKNPIILLIVNMHELYNASIIIISESYTLW